MYKIIFYKQNLHISAHNFYNNCIMCQKIFLSIMMISCKCKTITRNYINKMSEKIFCLYLKWHENIFLIEETTKINNKKSIILRIN